MNRLGSFLIGAALMTGASALASAQALPQNVAYHDLDRYRHRWDGRRWWYWNGHRWE